MGLANIREEARLKELAGLQTTTMHYSFSLMDLKKEWELKNCEFPLENQELQLRLQILWSLLCLRMLHLPYLYWYIGLA